MGKEVRAAIINVLHTTGGNHILDDTTNYLWGITLETYIKTDDPVQLAFGKTWGYGKCLGYTYENAVAEVRQIAVFGAETTEVIVASKQYSLKIGSGSEVYEGMSKGRDIYSYTSAAVLSGTAATDRATVYQAFVAKINARSTNFVTAYALHSQAYTLGTDSGTTLTNFIMGEVITQQTSTVTARIAKCTVASGTFVGDNAAGNLYFFNCSATASLDAGAKTWTGGTSTCVATGTAASIVLNVGLCIEDDATYHISHVNRGGISEVFRLRGFALDVWEVGLAGVYSRGIGAYMAKIAPAFNRGKDDIITLFGDYMLSMNDDIDATLTYRTYTLRFKETVKDMNGVSNDVVVTYVLFVSMLNTGTELDEFEAALVTAAAK